jgi:hypothetical protein
MSAFWIVETTEHRPIHYDTFEDALRAFLLRCEEAESATLTWSS